jgi:Phage P22-like portal protein
MAENLSALEQLEFLREARQRHADAFDAERTNREEAVDDLKFRAGEQWPEEIRQERKNADRPMLTINRTPQFVRQVIGDLRQAKPAIKVKPGDGGGDPKVAEVFSDHIRHIEYKSDAQAAYMTAAESAIACGVGHFRVLTEYVSENGFELCLKIERMPNALGVLWDPRSKKLTREDAQYCFVSDFVSEDEFKRNWPSKPVAEFDGDEGHADPTLQYWRQDRQIRIAEYWVKEPVKRRLGLLASGRVVDMGRLPPDVIPEMVVRQREAEGHNIVCYKISGTAILERNEWPGKYIPIIPVIGEEVHIGERTVRHGIIRFAKDPQRLYNYWRTAGAERIALAPKQPALVTPEQIKGHEKSWKRLATSNLPYLKYNPDPKVPNGRPTRLELAQIPNSEWKEAEIAQDDMKATTGIYDAALGARSNETSGRAILARQQESDTGTVAYSDALARAIRHCGCILIDLIPKVYDTERTIKLRGEDESEREARVNVPMMTQQGPGYGTALIDGDEVELLPGIDYGDYDVAVTVGPSYSTKRLEASDSMMAFVQAVPNAAPAIGDLIAKNQDWPGADEIAKRLRRLAVAAGVAEPDPEDEEMATPAAPPPDPEKMAAAAHKAAQAEGVELDNAKKQVELAALTGQMQEAVALAVQQTLAQLLGAAPPMPQAPMPPAMPGAMPLQ